MCDTLAYDNALRHQVNKEFAGTILFLVAVVGLCYFCLTATIAAYVLPLSLRIVEFLNTPSLAAIQNVVLLYVSVSVILFAVCASVGGVTSLLVLACLSLAVLLACVGFMLYKKKIAASSSVALDVVKDRVHRLRLLRLALSRAKRRSDGDGGSSGDDDDDESSTAEEEEESILLMDDTAVGSSAGAFEDQNQSSIDEATRLRNHTAVAARHQLALNLARRGDLISWGCFPDAIASPHGKIIVLAAIVFCVFLILTGIVAAVWRVPSYKVCDVRTSQAAVPKPLDEEPASQVAVRAQLLQYIFPDLLSTSLGLPSWFAVHGRSCFERFAGADGGDGDVVVEFVSEFSTSNINMSLFDPNVSSQYASLAAFQTRRFKHGVRPLLEDNHPSGTTIVSPCECRARVYDSIEHVGPSSSASSRAAGDADVGSDHQLERALRVVVRHVVENAGLLSMSSSSSSSSSLSEWMRAPVAVFRLAPQDPKRLVAPVSGRVIAMTTSSGGADASSTIVAIDSTPETLAYGLPFTFQQKQDSSMMAQQLIVIHGGSVAGLVALVVYPGTCSGGVKWFHGLEDVVPLRVGDSVDAGDEIGVVRAETASVVALFGGGMIVLDPSLVRRSQFLHVESLVQLRSRIGLVT